QAVREQAAKEQAAKEQAARQQAAREQAAREQAAEEQAAKEQAAREQAARERAAKERAAEKQTAGDYSRVLLRNEIGDSVRLLKVFPRPGTRLTSGQSTELKFLVHYTLQSRDRAILAISIAQTNPLASSCNSKGGSLVDANQVVITRGERDVQLSVVWN